ncbi:unnamed protein product [Spirodela intermedia]|uniref:Uncharacterized protein n=1 Tax=Spirodela intermedia TaxID=51605 RepID=A0A7I8JX27_SPIIN|nr:unnamed protein product [Spirodela intermedia]
MASSVRNRRASTPSSSALPPRVLNVQKFAESRAAELEALHAIVASRNERNFRLQRCKRRRTSSHDARIARGGRGRKRPRLGRDEAPPGKGQEESGEEKKKLPRRVRRRMMLRKNMEFGFSVSGDGTERLRTHLWHAKRFTMVKRWGFYLPLGLHGRGRGSRAILKRLKSGALLHDSSYCSPILLEGPEDSILDVLRMVLVQPQLDFSEGTSQLVFHGVCYQSAMLHHIGGPLSKLISPVTYMWRPVIRHSDASVDTNPVHNGACSNELSIPYRQLWIWVHAAAFNEAFDVLAAASQKQRNTDGVSVNCLSLKGKLGKLELIGSEATQILQKILHSASDEQEGSVSLQSVGSIEHCSISTTKISMLSGGAEDVPSCAIISLNVVDPRDVALSRGNEAALLATSADIQSDLLKEALEESSIPTPASLNLNEENKLPLWPDPARNAKFISDCKDLWDSHDSLKPPIDDCTLCLEKHHKRLKRFYMDDTNPVTSPSESQERGSRTCPVLLLKHKFQNKTHQGWSIILPLSWVKSFWIPLVSCGAHAIGLREKRWVASDGGVPCFPFDFPDCKAYMALMSAVAAEVEQMAELRPPSVRPSRIPIPPPWDCVRSSIVKLPDIIRSSQMLQTEMRNDGKLPSPTSRFDSSMGTSSLTAQAIAPSYFHGSIARTGDAMNRCLNHINASHLLVFPNYKMGKKAFSDLMNKERVNWVPRSIKRLHAGRPLLFSRVLLRPCREGAFEEGAVVCAPLLSDILSLASRAEEREKLQISQSTVDSGSWAMQVPEDPSHRWPIGFVTSGFTRGSAHPMAMAVCEVTLLAQLREQQWSEMLEKSRPEVLVLVRNMRSTAYRLSRASIVLEHGHDLDFM